MQFKVDKSTLDRSLFIFIHWITSPRALKYVSRSSDHSECDAQIMADIDSTVAHSCGKRRLHEHGCVALQFGLLIQPRCVWLDAVIDHILLRVSLVHTGLLVRISVLRLRVKSPYRCSNYIHLRHTTVGMLPSVFCRQVGSAVSTLLLFVCRHSRYIFIWNIPFQSVILRLYVSPLMYYSTCIDNG